MIKRNYFRQNIRSKTIDALNIDDFTQSNVEIRPYVASLAEGLTVTSNAKCFEG